MPVCNVDRYNETPCMLQILKNKLYIDQKLKMNSFITNIGSQTFFVVTESLMFRR